jgi:hypothetical protein
MQTYHFLNLFADEDKLKTGTGSRIKTKYDVAEVARLKKKSEQEAKVRKEEQRRQKEEQEAAAKLEQQERERLAAIKAEEERIAREAERVEAERVAAIVRQRDEEQVKVRAKEEKKLEEQRQKEEKKREKERVKAEKAAEKERAKEEKQRRKAQEAEDKARAKEEERIRKEMSAEDQARLKAEDEQKKAAEAAIRKASEDRRKAINRRALIFRLYKQFLLDETNRFALRFVRALKPAHKLGYYSGRFPLTYFRDKRGVFGFKFEMHTKVGKAFIGSSIFLATILVFLSAQLIDLFTYKDVKRMGPDLQMAYFQRNVIFNRYMVDTCTCFCALILGIVVSSCIYKRREYIPKYYTFWTE